VCDDPGDELGGGPRGTVGVVLKVFAEDCVMERMVDMWQKRTVTILHVTS
jgi:hypothetical protein